MYSDQCCWQDCVLSPKTTIREAAKNLNETSLKIVLVADDEGLLKGTVCDGDIRRGLLGEENLDSELFKIMKTDPLVAPESWDRSSILQLMNANKVQQVPIVDAENKLVGLHLWDEVNTPLIRENTVVIMAGGKGVRLRPHTFEKPKPMVEVAGKPMLEHIIERAKAEGFRNFVLAVHYLGHVIENYFGDGEKFGVKIQYLKEKEPLGTAGALSLLDADMKKPFIVTNSDIMTDVKLSDMLLFHEKHNSFATMAVKLHEFELPFGVVEVNELEIIGFTEKPTLRSRVNSGIYVLDPSSLDHLQRDEPCDMPQLFEKLRFMGEKITAYPMHEPWLDVGRPDDLKKARNSNTNV